MGINFGGSVDAAGSDCRGFYYGAAFAAAGIVGLLLLIPENPRNALAAT